MATGLIDVPQGLAWLCRDQWLDLTQPRVMGIVNVTPDSFSDGGQHDSLSKALAHAHLLIEQGADILDLGGESTRPGAPTVPVEQELARVIPLLKALAGCGALLSVDTRKPEVMREAAAAGAHILNDVQGFTSEGAMDVAAESGCAVVAMHMQGNPATMQQQPQYGDVVAEVNVWLLERARALEQAGVAAAKIALDPGFGFGKTFEHNLALFRALTARYAGRYPCLVGVSRKSMLGAMIGGKPPAQRVTASAVAVVAAMQRGVRLFRVHDVAATRDAIAVWRALHGDGV